MIADLFDRGYERVIYFDPDIKVYGSVAPILARLDGAQIVLTPHLTDCLGDDGKHPSELAILQSGTYNLGFIALRRTEATRRFVSWWQSKLLRDCVVDIPRGLFTDQKWIDLVPGMFVGQLSSEPRQSLGALALFDGKNKPVRFIDADPIASRHDR